MSESTTAESSPPPHRDSPATARRLGLGCAGLALLGLLVPGALWFTWSMQQSAEQQALEDAQRQKAEETFSPAMDALANGAADPGYDIDATIRAIHDLDRALGSKDSLEDYVQHVSTQDYRDVAPEVLEARKALMEPLLELYARQLEAEDQQAMWESTSELLLSTLSVVSLSGNVGLTDAGGGLSIDRQKAQELLDELKAEQAEREELARAMAELETEILGKMMDYGDVYYRYLEEWDRLSVKRDRAYLAVHNGEWDKAIEAADEAIALAPLEREAHLLKAWAMIERGVVEDDSAVFRLLDEYKERHPDSTAPALVLEGTLHARRGRTAEAELAFQQSAAYFPRQSAALADMADPYRARGYLRKSREGSFILELYQSTMLGAGAFSPDLQMASMLFAQGDREAGEAKILDHFARRRTQKEWGFVLSDVQFCHALLGPRFWDMFPEEPYLDLVVAPPIIGAGVNVSIRNRSPRTLHNATLVLAVQFTDMYPDDYETLAAPETIPAVIAHETTSFGHMDMTATVFGEAKDRDDVVRHRAILIADEAVTWVETEQYRLAEAEEFRQARRTDTAGTPGASHPDIARHPEFRKSVEAVRKQVMGDASLQLDTGYGADDVLITLPRELAILRPIFKLRYGDTVFDAKDNLIEGDRIQLRFAGVQNFDDEQHDPLDMELLVASPFGDIRLEWQADGSLTWRLGGTP